MRTPISGPAFFVSILGFLAAASALYGAVTAPSLSSVAFREFRVVVIGGISVAIVALIVAVMAWGARR